MQRNYLYYTVFAVETDTSTLWEDTVNKGVNNR